MIKQLDHKAAVALLILAVVAVFANSLGGDFVWDDINIVVLRAPFYDDWSTAVRALGMMDSNSPDPFNVGAPKFTPYYRPLTTASFVASYKAWGLNPFGYRLTSLLLHALTAVLLYLLALRLFKDRAAALFASLLFALHPVNVEAVSFISARNNLLCAAFMLGTLIALERRKEMGRHAWPALLLFSAALLSKEPAVVLPLFVLLRNILRPARDDKSVGPKLIAAFFCITALYFALRLLVLGVFISEPVTEPFASRAGLVLSSLFEHFRHLLVPVGLSAAYDVNPVGLFSFKAVAAAAGFVGLVYTAYRKDAPKPLRWGALWLLLGLLPVINIVPIPSAPVADRYLYIPALGFCLMAGSLFEVLRIKRPSAAMVAAAVLVAAMASLSLVRVPVWKNDISLWEDTVAKSPQMPIVRNNLGTAYLKADRNGEAVEQYTAALGLLPKEGEETTEDTARSRGKIHNNLGLAYMKMRSDEKALAHFMKALSLKHSDGKTHLNIGDIFSGRGNFDKAIQHYFSAAALDPGSMAARNKLGVIYLRFEEPSKALKEFQKALEIAPGEAGTHINLGIAYQKMGSAGPAATHYRKAIELNPRMPDAHFNLGALHLDMGDLVKARKEFEAVLLLNPDDREAERLIDLMEDHK